MQKRQGFTLIELMIVIAIIAIIAAIAIPNLMASRIRANEAASITCVKQYGTAQVTFQSGRQGRDTANSGGGDQGYADNYRNLFYGLPVGDVTRNLELISQAFADAFLTGYIGGTLTAVNPATPTAIGAGAAYQGYLFTEPSGTDLGGLPIDSNWFQTNFALVGTPANPGTTGNNSYWCSMQGTVYMRGETAGGVKTVADFAATPTAGMTAATPDGWAVL